MTLQPVQTGFRLGLVDFIQEGDDSLLWIASRNCLLVYSFRTRQFARVDVGFSQLYAMALIPGKKGNLWFGGNGQILHIRDFKVAARVPSPGLVFVAQDQQEQIWFGSYAGLFRVPEREFTPSRISHFTTANGLSENTLRSGFVDREDNLWIGGIAKGIQELSGRNTFRFALEGVNPAYQYSIGASDSNGHIWVATPKGLSESWRDSVGQWRQAFAHIEHGVGEQKPYRIFHHNGTPVSTALPYSLFVDHKGKLWIGYSNAELSCYEVKARGVLPSQLRLVQTFRPKIDFPDGFPQCFVVDRNDMVWYSNEKGIALLDPKRSLPLVRLFGSQDGLPVTTTYVRALACDAQGNIWAGMYQGGIARLNADSISRGSFHPFPLRNNRGPSQQTIAAIREDMEGRIWIASETNGLIVIGGTKQTTVSAQNGLPSSIVTSTTRDRLGRVWVSTGVGVAYIDSSQRETIHRESELADSYMFCSGLTKDGLLWFVTIGGLIVYDPSAERKLVSIPPPLITDFQANGVRFPLSDALSLAYDRNNIEIGFISLTFRDQKDVRYQYRMSGVDADWHQPSAVRSVTYAALSPGDYSFEVRSLDARGVPSTGNTALRFSIVPPFWGRWWFTTLLWTIPVLALAGTIRFVELRKTRRRLQELEHLRVRDRERLRISRDMHDEVGASLTEIAILSELAKRSGVDAAVADNHLGKISEKSRAVIDNIGEIIWAINPKNDPLEDFVAYIHRYAVEYFAPTPIKCHVEISERLPDIQLASEYRRNAFLIVKEALHNIVKHSGAAKVVLKLGIHDGAVVITIEDNGNGIQVNSSSGEGIGLHSMRKRAEEIGGALKIEPNQPSGTRVSLGIPMRSERSGD